MLFNTTIFPLLDVDFKQCAKLSSFIRRAYSIQFEYAFRWSIRLIWMHEVKHFVAVVGVVALFVQF